MGNGPTWHQVARPDQLAPDGSWRTWLILTGRGWGKTRTGAETVAEWVRAGTAKLTCIAAQTAADARDVSAKALLRALPGAVYEPSKRSVTYGNWQGITFSAEDPDSFRGYEFDSAWLDEVAAWRFPESYDQLQYGLRVGAARQIVTSTPRPVRVIRELLNADTTVVTRGRTLDNADNLSPSALAYLISTYQGTRIGRQELEGELLEDVPGALWSRALINMAPVPVHFDGTSNVPDVARIVIGIDPAVTSGEDSDETGIVVVALGSDSRGYVLDDLSGRYSPDEWAKKAVAAYEQYSADRIVAEVNNGGDLIEKMLRLYGPNLPISKVHARQGKHTRAEPVAALYEQGRVSHVRGFPTLEDQMCAFTGNPGEDSPDRMDALVWALTDLMLGNGYVGSQFSMVA
jgi:predicted phage terminase large subunit-like protein